jgi:hypothetical protein
MATAEVVSQIETMTLGTPGVAEALGSHANLKRKILRARRKVTGEPCLGRTRAEIKIPDCLKVNLRSENFLLHDSEGANRILIYATSKNLTRLANCETWLMDGTFKICPSLFYQIYTIHGLYKNDIVPFVYAFLPNKTQKTYEELFTRIASCNADGDNISPKLILSDFELAAIQAVRKVFPEAQPL